MGKRKENYNVQKTKRKKHLINIRNKGNSRLALKEIKNNRSTSGSVQNPQLITPALEIENARERVLFVETGLLQLATLIFSLILYEPVIGIRHLQTIMMFLVVTVLYIIRSSMGVAILAMTERKHASSSNRTDENGTAVGNDTGGNIDTDDDGTYDWNENVQGIILSAFFWGYMINQIPGGVVAKRFGGKPVLLVSLIVNGLLCLAVPLLARFGGWQAVCAVRWLMGLTQCLFPCCHTLLGKWIPPQERTTLSNIAYAGVQVGTIIAMPLGGVLARTAFGWKLIFYSMAGLAFLTAALWQGLAASTPAEHPLIGELEKNFIEESLASHDDQKSTSIPWRSLATSVPLWSLVVAHIGCNWCFTIFFVEIPAYMKNVLTINLRDSGMLSALPFIAMWLFSMFNSVICEYFYNHNILTITTSRKLFNSIGTFGPSIGLVILSFVTKEHSYVAITVLTLTVGVQSGIMSGFMLNHLDLSPTYAGIMLGITNCVANVFGALAPILAGYLLGDYATELSRWRMLFFISALIAILTNVVFLIWGTSERQPWDDPSYKKNKQIFKAVVIKAEKTYSFEEKH